MSNRAFISRICMSLLLVLASGCAGGSVSGDGAGSTRRDPVPRPGSTVVALEFVRAWESVPGQPYFPFEGLAGCAFTEDGTLVVCDESRGRVHGHDPVRLTWWEFDQPPGRPYRPLDALADGFKVLVLDRGGSNIFRFDLNGSYLDRLLNVHNADPAVRTVPAGFAMDRDGRMVISDVSEQQVLLLDAFLAPQMRLGDPGSGDDQLSDPSGVVFLPDGSIVVSDRGNRRLAVYGRLGFFESTVGGDGVPDNPFVTPQGLASDRFGNLFVADQGSGLIHVLDRRLRPLFSAGADFPLAGIPQFPVDVAVGPDNNLAVTDRARAAVLIYRIVYE